MRRLREFGEERFHFRFGVGVAFLRCDGDAGVEDLFGFVGAGFANEQLRVHEIGGNVVGVACEELAEMGISGGRVAGVHAIECVAVAGVGVVGILGDVLL